eukprot:gene29751-35924_t
MVKKSKKIPEPEPESEEEETEEEQEDMDIEDEEGSEFDETEELEIEDDDQNDSGDEGEDVTEEEDNGDTEEEQHVFDPSKMQDPKVVRARIDDALEELENLRSSQRSRSQIMEDLAKDLSEYYGYLPELTDLFLSLFSPHECVEFMDANDRPRPLVIRANTLKTTRKDLMEVLTKRGAVVEEVPWSPVGIKVTESPVPIGATPEYLAGHYMLQAASSLNPVMALDAQPGERVLDMSSAPGGKTSYLSQMMKNSGCVIANDLKPNRQKATIANLQRLGVKNAIVCCHDGRYMGGVTRDGGLKGFDRILLDAPCSGLGIISRDQSVKLTRTLKDIQRNAHLQKELLRSAVERINVHSSQGGYVVYSTCSVSVEENEMVVQYILDRKYVTLVDTQLAVGKEGLTSYRGRKFHPSLKLTRRFYPHVHNMDGFFVAKLKVHQQGDRDGFSERDTHGGGHEEGADELSEEEEAARGGKRHGRSKDQEKRAKQGNGENKAQGQKEQVPGKSSKGSEGKSSGKDIGVESKKKPEKSSAQPSAPVATVPKKEEKKTEQKGKKEELKVEQKVEKKEDKKVEKKEEKSRKASSPIPTPTPAPAPVMLEEPKKKQKTDKKAQQAVETDREEVEADFPSLGKKRSIQALRAAMMAKRQKGGV